MIDYLEGRYIKLCPIEESDLRILWKWRNSTTFIQFCSVRRNIVNYEEFVAELNNDFERDRHLQLVVKLKGNGATIGTIYSYSLNLVDGYVFITTYLDKDYQNKGYGVEVVAIFLKYLFESFPLYKIYMEVYGYNRSSVSVVEKAGFKEEGRFKEHKFFNEGRHDLVRFAVYRSDLDRIKEFLARLKNRDKRIKKS